MDFGGHQIELQTLYQDAKTDFSRILQRHLQGLEESHWPAISDAVRGGIRWPQLDRYLDESPELWMPMDYVGPEAGLRGSLQHRNGLSHILKSVTRDAAHWYLKAMPGRIALKDTKAPNGLIEELMGAGIVQWCANQPLSAGVISVPFAEIKAAYILAGLPAPKSAQQAQEGFDQLIAIRGEPTLRNWMEEFFQASEYIDVIEPCNWDREERLGVRARANVMVSSLIVLASGDPGPLQILQWGKGRQ